MALEDDRVHASFRRRDDRELERTQSIAQGQEYPFRGSTWDIDETTLIEDQPAQHFKTAVEKVHAAGPSKQLVGSRMAMTHSPWSCRLVQQHSPFRVRHDPAPSQLLQLIVLVRLTHARPSFPALKDGDRLLYAILPPRPEIATV